MGPNPEHVDAGRCQFQRERDSLQLATDAGHERRVRVAELKALKALGCAFGEELDGGECDCLRRSQSGRTWRACQQGEALNLLTSQV